MTAAKVKEDLKKLADKSRGNVLGRFFKTGKGEYGEGDKFLGIKTPLQREVVKRYRDLSLTEIARLLRGKFHEERGVGLGILSRQNKRGGKKEREKIYRFYFKNLAGINNWDLVDGSAPGIVGRYLWENPEERTVLYKLAVSKNLWERRIAILATFYFIHEGELADIFKLGKILLEDKEDLMHKAVGWMLREAGKKDQARLEEFLKKFGPRMPRTMLRYAIEKFAEEKRKRYLAIKKID